MTDAEKRLIDAALAARDLLEWRHPLVQELVAARLALKRERTTQAQIDELIAAKLVYMAALERIKAARDNVSVDVIAEIYRERGWDTRGY